MITMVPEKSTPRKMPPLTRRSQATLDVLLSPTVPAQGYKTLLQRNNELIDEGKRLWNFAVAGICIFSVLSFLAGLYCR